MYVVYITYAYNMIHNKYTYFIIYFFDHTAIVLTEYAYMCIHRRATGDHVVPQPRGPAGQEPLQVRYSGRRPYETYGKYIFK